MKKRMLYAILALLGAISCSKSEDVGITQGEAIRVEVIGLSSPQSRANLLNSNDDIVEQGEFAISAYLANDNAEYFKDAWVYYFVSDDGNARWRFRDVLNQDYLIDFYWPDGEVNFMAYMPRILTKCAATIDDLAYDVANGGARFNAALPSEINDRTEAEREAESAKHEFVLATHLNQSKSNGGAVKLRFVHPFAAIKFRLHQSHRDLVIHSIMLHGLDQAGTFEYDGSTYEPYDGGNMGQSYITYDNWQGSGSGDLTINLEKSVPEDVNYNSQIGGPYMVIPQMLQAGGKDVKLSVRYTWNGSTVESSQFSISTAQVGAWQPGNIYTYTLDLGDNKEEILFKVLVEEWSKGEDDGYENNYDVQ